MDHQIIVGTAKHAAIESPLKKGQSGGKGKIELRGATFEESGPWREHMTQPMQATYGNVKIGILGIGEGKVTVKDANGIAHSMKIGS